MAEGGQTPAKSTPTLKELSNALDSILNWFSLGVKLGVEDHELGTIDKNFHGDNERCKLEMLSRWLRNAKPPTWKAVANALCLVGEHRVAAKIREKHCSFSTDTDTETPPVTSPQSPSAVTIAQRSVLRIKGKFSILVTKSHRKLQSRKIDVDDVQMFLITMYSSPNSRDGSDTVTVVVESARNLSEIFRALSRYGLWDYLNYYLLQDMIEEFAHDDDELNGMMEQYQKDLTGHILTLRIQTYLDATHDELPLVSTNDSENSDDATIPALPPQQKYQLFKKLTGKIKANVTDHTLSYVTDLWRSLANQFALPRPAMILHDIAEGCIGITWLIPANLVTHVTRMARETTNMFSEEQILTVMLEKRCIYPMETELVSEPTLLETEPSQLLSEPRLLETETTALKRKIEGFTGGRRSPNLPAESTDGSRSWDLPVSGQDERENPEDIPEYELSMKGCRVMRANYSFLWQYLEPSRLLPILVDKLLMTETKKKEAESYTQKFAQNSVIIDELFASGCPPLKLCDTLDVTGQGHIARKLLQDYKHLTLRKVRPPSEATTVRSDISEASELFQQLQREVMDLLDHIPNALAKLKQVLASLVLPLGQGKVAPLVDPLAYKDAKTVQELFRLMAPYWNPLSTDLLGLLLEASGCNQAASKVAEFVEARASKGHLVLCIRQLPTLASGENDLDVADFETVHNAPLSELQSLHPAVFARLPEHKVTSSRTTVRISVEVSKPLLCIADYEEITTALSGFFWVPKAALVYAGCSKAPLVLCWLASHELVAYIKLTSRGVSGHRLLVESKVTGVAVGDRTYKCPTIKEVELWEACHYGLVGQVLHLLTTGVSVNVTDFDGFFPLYSANQEGHDRIVEMLLQAGATVDLQTKNGATALELASRNGHHEVVELLLGARANPDLQDKSGFFPLYSASQEGHDRIVEMLLHAGATVDLQTKDGWTALEQASIKGHHKVVELLLGAGANPDLQNKNGFSPLSDASQEGYDGIVEMLLHAGATVDLQNEDGSTPLQTACHQGHILIVEHLIPAKADVNHQKKDGVTTLMIASYNGHPSVVRVLLQAGATINTTSQLGETALYCAVDHEHEDIVDLLLEANADPDLPLKESQETPLMVAAKKGSARIIRKLMKHGATINLTNKAGNTAYDIASFEGHTDVCQELLTQQS